MLNLQMKINNRDMDDGSDLEEPMASQSADVEGPLPHNSSKSNFFSGDEAQSQQTKPRGSFKNRESPNYNKQYPKGTAQESVELRPMTSASGGMTSPTAHKSRMVGAVPTPFATGRYQMQGQQPQPPRYGQQPAFVSQADTSANPMTRSYNAHTSYVTHTYGGGGANSPGRRYNKKYKISRPHFMRVTCFQIHVRWRIA